MDGFDNDPKGLPTGMTISVADIETIQFTNNLDGILRDGNGEPIPLDNRDFRHQAYYGEKVNNSECDGRPRRYVFKGGKLIEKQNQSESDRIVC